MSEHRVGARSHARALVLKAYLSSAVAVGALAAALAVGLAWPSEAAPQCMPAANAAGPSNMMVNCSGTVTNQNSPNGYGTGNQNNDTINVTPNATVSGSQTGFFVGSGNSFSIGTGATVQDTNAFPNAIGAIVTTGGVTVTNSGSVLGGSGLGINAESGDVTVTNNSGATINAPTARPYKPKREM